MPVRISKITKEYNIGLETVKAFLQDHGVDPNSITANSKVEDHHYELIKEAFGADKALRTEADKMFHAEPKEKKAEPKAKAKKVEAPKAEVAPVEPTPAQDVPAKAEEAEVPVKETIAAEPETTPAQEEVAEAPAKEVAEAKAEAAPAPTAEEATPVPSEEKLPAQAETTVRADEKNDKGKQPKAKPTVEERAKAIGKENEDGVFELKSKPVVTGPKVLGSIDLSALNQTTHPKKKTKEERKKEREEKRAGTGGQGQGEGKKKRQRIGKERVDIATEAKHISGASGGGKQGGGKGQGNANAQNANAQGSGKKKKKNRNAQPAVQPISDEEVAQQVKETLARLQGKTKGAKGAKYRKEKREAARERQEEQMAQEHAESKILKLTEYVTANELATMMNVPVTKVISTCFSIGIMVSINQRMDAETIDLVAEECGFKTEYVSADVQEAIAEEADNAEDLTERAPIVTVMGHVDHGKTSLLDHIRNANVIAGEAGGITQHIGAYNVQLKNGRHITFLDTPGHEAFTAMRARGAQVTDIAIIIIAADDDIMPQTKEAISHAVAAGVPIVFAINKIDKPGANVDKIKEGLANMNFLVEDWGGKYQSQDISAKKGIGVYELLEKVLLEADMLELKANPNRKAVGTVIESSLDKGRGYVATVLVSNGTLHQGDVILAGTNFGKVKALFNERGQRIKEVGPAQAAMVLGLNGAPQAGDQLHSMETEQEAREIASRREQLAREQSLRTTKRRGLGDIAHEIAIGGVQELNLLVKGDVDGSVEALADSFIKLSTENIVVNVIHKGVGQISENDVTLAAASKAVIIGFQVRPSVGARKLADHEGVEIRQYSIIYDAIEEIKGTMEGMLKPVIKEEVTATVEVRQVYHISKVGFVAGAYVMDGKVARSNKARLIRDGIVIFTGDIAALKRFKDDVKEVNTNFECGISLQGCNDIKEGDLIETYQEVEVKQKL